MRTDVRIERKTAGDVTILALAGAIDADAVRTLDENTEAVVETGCHRLVLSLGEVEFFDSRVIAFLAAAHQRLAEVKGEMVVSAARNTRGMLQALGVAPQLKVFAHDRAALAHFGQDGAWPEEHPPP